MAFRFAQPIRYKVIFISFIREIPPMQQKEMDWCWPWQSGYYIVEAAFLLLMYILNVLITPFAQGF